MRTIHHPEASPETLALDGDQQRVVDHEGPLVLVHGGPGTGKTSVLCERYIRLALRASPDRILFLVPNRAQKIALRDKLTRRLLFDEGLEALVEVPVYTWHGFANHLVSRHYEDLGYGEPPVLLTSPEQWSDVRDALAAENPINWPHHRTLLRNRGFVDEVVDFCIRAEQRALDESQLAELAVRRPRWTELIRFFKAHRARLKARSRIDYPILLREAIELIANFEHVRDALHRRFTHVLVDDGQELALVQQRLLYFLSPASGAGEGRSLVLAGDADSAIETFRGGDPDWTDDFDKEFGPHDTVTLSTSYRLGPEPGARVTDLMARNGPQPHRPTGFAGRSSLEVRRFASLAVEVESIARELRSAHLNEGLAYEDMAILLTSPRAMLPALERALDAMEVPFSISAPDRPLAREPMVRAFTDLARFAFDVDPDPVQVTQLLRSPLVDLDDSTVRELERLARVSGTPLAEMLEERPELEDESAAGRLAELIELRDILRTKRAAPADEAFWLVWERSQACRTLSERARRGLDDPANRDLDALVAFSRALGRFVERRRGSGTFENYLETIGRADFGSDPWLPPERSGGGVNVVSFHGAKGKEWSIVAVAGVVQGAIPKGRRASGLFDPYFLDETDPVARSIKNEMEDRRVFYVAATRATKRCILTSSPGASRRGEPSRFIEELMGHMPEIESHSDVSPLTFSEAAARYRRTLSDVRAPKPARVAALAGIARINELDPTCTAARPSEWWWRWDWTSGSVPIRAQQAQGDDELPPNKLRTSYSRISTYDNCGLQYLMSVVLGFDPESSHNMAFGSWMHKIFEECETGRITNERAAHQRLTELFDESVFPNKAVARQFRREGEVMINRYVHLLKPGKAAVAETSFKVPLDGHLITGRIDRVDAIGKNLVVSDYKTSRHVVSWEEARESLQLAIYYLAARSIPELTELGKPVSMQLVYPNAPLSKNDVQKRCQKPEEAEAALERLPVLIEGVLTEDFRPNPEADCMWCKFKPLCPLWAEGKELPA